MLGGRAIFDPSENNLTTTTDPFTEEEIAAAIDFQSKHRFRGPDFLPIPPASSGMMLELTGEVVDRGEESTPIYNPFHADPEQFNATHSDIDAGRSHHNSLSAHDLQEIIVVPGGAEAFVLHAYLLGLIVFQQAEGSAS